MRLTRDELGMKIAKFCIAYILHDELIREKREHRDATSIFVHAHAKQARTDCNNCKRYAGKEDKVGSKAVVS